MTSGHDANTNYRPFLLPTSSSTDTLGDSEDWTATVDLDRATSFAASVFGQEPLRVLILYGSLRERRVIICAFFGLCIISLSTEQVILETTGIRGRSHVASNGM